jgi:hypothetical protein
MLENFVIGFLIGIIFYIFYLSKPKSAGSLKRVELAKEKKIPFAPFKDREDEAQVICVVKDMFLFSVVHVFRENDAISTHLSDIAPRMVFIGVLGQWRFWYEVKKNL